MPVSFQDYYETLGVERNATQDEVQRAFRKLARKYHPDVSSEPGAEDKFKEINEANEVLKDPEKRKKYDQLGEHWKSGETFTPPPQWEGFEFHFEGPGAETGDFSDFFETLFGGGAPFVRTTGTRGGVLRRRGRDQEADIEISLQEAAEGAKKSIELESYTTDTDGSPKKTSRKFEVNVPKGVTSGSRIRLAGQGGKGSGGGPDGDLFLSIRLRADPRFTVEGRNLRTRIFLSPWEAALGTEVSVPTLDGTVTMKVPPGTQSDQIFRLRGKGLPRTSGAPGDILATAKVVIPKDLTKREKTLFEKLAKEATFNPRETNESKV